MSLLFFIATRIKRKPFLLCLSVVTYLYHNGVVMLCTLSQQNCVYALFQGQR